VLIEIRISSTTYKKYVVWIVLKFQDPNLKTKGFCETITARIAKFHNFKIQLLAQKLNKKKIDEIFINNFYLTILNDV